MRLDGGIREKILSRALSWGILVILFALPVSATAGIPGSGSDQPAGSGDGGDSFLITSMPCEISRPGVYSLQPSIHSDINGAAIIIRTSDVVINGNGCTLSGMGTGTSGIVVDEPSRCRNITLFNCTITGFERGIRVINSDLVRISTMSVLNCSAGGIEIGDCGTVSLQDFSIRETGYGDVAPAALMLTDSSTVVLQNGSILSNGGTASLVPGMAVKNCHTISAMDLTVEKNSGDGIVIDSDTGNSLIQESSIEGNAGSGIVCFGSDGLTISGVSLVKNKYSGISLEQCSGCSLIDLIADSNLIGISISESENLHISGGRILRNRINFDISASSPAYLHHQIDSSTSFDGRKGLYLDGVSGQVITGADNPAFIVAVNCSDISVSDLVLSKNGNGIFLVGCRNVSVQQVMSLTNGIGFRTGYNSSMITFSQCSAEENLIAGYLVSSSEQITIAGCHVQESPAGYAAIQARNVTIQDSSADRIVGPARKAPSGFSLTDCEDCEISGCTSLNAGYAGIALVNGSSIRVRDTTAGKNTVAGIIVRSPGTEIIGNEIISNKKTGLLISSTGTLVSGNEISSNIYGIGISSATSAVITNNRLSNSKNVQIAGGEQLRWNTTAGGEDGDIHGIGNVWSDPDGTGYSDTCTPDEDGICTPYLIAVGNNDYYPLSASRYGNMTVLSYDLNDNGHGDFQDIVLCMNRISAGDQDPILDYNRDSRLNLADVVFLFETMQSGNDMG